MHDPDTIVAISTPPGRGGIGIVRLSGPQAREIAAPLLRLRHELAPGHARFGEILDLTGPAPNSVILSDPELAEGESKDPDALRPVAAARTILPIEPSNHASNLEPRTSNLTDAPVLDEAVATYFAAPHSYTSEDIVEIAAHGSPVLLEYIVRECCDRGARLAEPGEFTQRAFLAGRIDLTQAEAVHDLIASSTLEQARVAARQLGGALAHTVAPIKADLVALIATLEAGIDFAEDDIDVLPAAQILTRIAAVRVPLATLEQSFAYGRIVRDGFKLAIVGRPNAGKSSLFNRLVQRDRAIVTAAPGTTRDLVTERVAIDGIPVDLIDTAGLRDSSDEAERLGIAKSHQAIAEADVVLLVIDATSGISPEDRAILTGVAASAEFLLIAANKTDLLPNRLQIQIPHPGPPPNPPTADRRPLTADSQSNTVILSEVHNTTQDPVNLGEVRSAAKDAVILSERSEAKDPEALHPIPTTHSFPIQIPNPTIYGAWNLEPGTPAPIPTSALTGAGIPELRAAIVAAVAGPNATQRESALLTNLRQHQSVQQSLAALSAASAAVQNRIPHEMLLLDLYAALRALDTLTGATTTDDILHLIFSTFCIGK